MNNLLDIYTDYLISSTGATTATGLSRLSGNQISHDKITRFLREAYLDSRGLWQHAKPLVRQVESDEGVLIVDDSIAEKEYTDENAMITWHWDHSKQRYIKGINFLSLLYYSQEVSVPIGVTLIEKTVPQIDPKSGKTKYVSPKTKNEYFRGMLKTANRQVKYRYVLGDSWFSGAENLQFIIDALRKHFIMAIECSRTVALNEQDRAAGKFQRVDALAELTNDACLVVYLRGIEKPVLLVKQVFTNKDGSQGTLYLVCSDTSLDFDATTTIYKKRWKVEEYHKSLKQNASLAKSPTKTVLTQANHFFASILAFIKLEKLKIKTGLGHFQLKANLYFVALNAMSNQLAQFRA
jgi:hypothetical protein